MRDYYCCSCGTKYKIQKANFPASQSPFYKGNNGYLPICKTCFENYTNQYEEKLGSSDAAIQRMCLHWDMYFNDSILSSSKKISADRSRISGYISKANLSQYQGKTYDTYLEESENNAINSLEDLEAAQEKDISISEKSVKNWGFGLEVSDYDYLNNQYSDWRAKVVIDGKARETLVRDLCVIKLQQTKALIKGDIDLYDKLTKTYQSTLASANLKPIQEDTQDKQAEKPMGVMISLFEDSRPIPQPDPEWEDVDGIVHLLTVYFLGHLCKMLGLKNRYAKMYEDEMQKYRVEIEELEDSDDEDVFEYLVNNGVPSDGDESDGT